MEEGITRFAALTDHVEHLLGNRLLRLCHRGPGIGFLQAAERGCHGKLVAAREFGQFFPINRHRDRRTCTGTDRIRGDRGRTPFVAEVVDKDFVRTGFLGHRSDVVSRRGLHNGVGDGAREIIDLVPRMRSPQRHHEVQPFATAGLEKTLEAQVLQKLADFARLPRQRAATSPPDRDRGRG